MDWVKVDGVWKETDTVFAKVSDVWKEVDQVYANSGGSWLEGWSGGDPLILQHTGEGQITITNAELTRTPKDYAVFTMDGTPVAGTSYANGVISLGSVFGSYKISYANKPNEGTPFTRAKITYTTGTRRVCDPCNPHCLPGCGGSGSPTCNPPGQDNDACYSCCWGCGPGDPRVIGQCCCPCNPNCYNQSYPIKDAVPAGYTERHGEWMKITNPVVQGVRQTEEQEAYPFAGGDTWPEEPYYIAFSTPEQTYAQTEPIDPENPTDEVERAWVFAYTIFLAFFDEDGNIYKSLDSQNDPENFIFVKGDGVTSFDEQQVFVKGIDGLVKGTYEMSWISQGTDENLPHTNIEDTFTLIKEISGNVA
jgi:hypothetical protein